MPAVAAEPLVVSIADDGWHDIFSMLGAHFLEMMGETKPARNVHGKNDLSSHGDEEEEDEEEEDHGNNEEEEEDDEDGSQYGNHQEKHTEEEPR